ncbi:MAG: CBS domain-containing protein [Christensenellales bacterium]
MNILFFLKPKNDIVFIYDYFTMRQALEKMKHHCFTAIPVIERNGKYAGTLSEGDLLWAMLEHEAFDKQTRENFRVREILKGRQNTPVNVNASIEDLFLMARSQNFIPVTDDRGLFIGIVTRSDILSYYHRKMEHKD